MSILLISDRDTNAWAQALKNAAPEVDLRIYPEDGNPNEVEYALVWNHPKGIFKKYPNLKVIASMGAGVDHILSDPELPKQALVTRIVNEQLATDMAEFVLALVLGHLRNLAWFKETEREGQWKFVPYLRIKEVKIGIMGLGHLGKSVAKQLLATGFRVQGWSRSPKDIAGVKSYVGQDQLKTFLGESRILICLLPLTPETDSILNRELFKQLPRDSFLINVARGQHLVEDDLIDALDSGQLSAAALDVFRKEPLPSDHPFWKHPKVQVTPHIASVTQPSAVVSQVLENYRRMQKVKRLINVVEPKQGY